MLPLHGYVEPAFRARARPGLRAESATVVGLLGRMKLLSRPTIAFAIDDLIDHLDILDGDSDFEPSGDEDTGKAEDELY